MLEHAGKFTNYQFTIITATCFKPLKKNTIREHAHVFPGMDATSVFQDINHSTEAKKMLVGYYIGELIEVSTICTTSFTLPGVVRDKHAL